MSCQLHDISSAGRELLALNRFAVLPAAAPARLGSSPLVIGAQMLQGSGVAGPTAALRARVCFLYCASSPSCDPARRHAGA